MEIEKKSEGFLIFRLSLFFNSQRKFTTIACKQLFLFEFAIAPLSTSSKIAVVSRDAERAEAQLARAKIHTSEYLNPCFLFEWYQWTENVLNCRVPSDCGKKKELTPENKSERQKGDNLAELTKREWKDSNLCPFGKSSLLPMSKIQLEMLDQFMSHIKKLSIHVYLL